MRNAHALHEGNGLLGFAVDCRSSEKQKAACTTYFPCRTLNPNSHPVLSPRGRELERGQQATRLVLRWLGYWERLPRFGRIPSPQPSPTGEGAGCSRFCGFRRFERPLGFTAVDVGRLKNKKQPAQPIFLAEPLTPTATPSSLPWERVRERATSRKACIEAIRELGEGCRNSRNALSPALPHGGGGGLQQIHALQVV